jgi:hypothetical protein
MQEFSGFFEHMKLIKWYSSNFKALGYRYNLCIKISVSMTTDSVLMCRNSSFVCFLQYPLFKKENVLIELGLTDGSSDGE